MVVCFWVSLKKERVISEVSDLCKMGYRSVFSINTKSDLHIMVQL